MKKIWKDSYTRTYFLIFGAAFIIFAFVASILSEERNLIQDKISGLISLSLVVSFIILFKKGRKIKRGNVLYFKYILLFLGLPITLSFLLPNSSFLIKTILYLGVTALVLLLLLVSFMWMRVKLTYITKEGIRIGNAYFNCGNDIILRQKPTFLKWGKIKSLKIKGRVSLGGISILNDYLVLETVEGRKFECFLNKPNDFLKTIKTLGKSNLFSKDSKYIK